MHMKKILIVCFLITLCLLPTSVSAISLSGSAYGGLVTAALYCTCSNNWLVTYSILYPLLTAGASTHTLIYQPGSTIAYGYQQFVTTPTPTTWQLGFYAPGAVECLMTAPNPDDPCLILPASGRIISTGASFPGAM